MHKWGLAPSPNCECVASEQTADHVLTTCSIHRAPHGTRGLTFWMTKFEAGLITPLPASDSGSAAVWGSKRINPRPQSCLCLTWSGCPLNDDDDHDDELCTKAKIFVFTSVFVPILTYGHESWVKTERVKSQVPAAEMGFLRKVRGLFWLDKVKSIDIH